MRVVVVLVVLILVQAGGSFSEALSWEAEQVLDGMCAASTCLASGVLVGTVVSTDYADNLSPEAFDACVDELVEEYVKTSETEGGYALSEAEIAAYRAEMVQLTKGASEVTKSHLKEMRYAFDGDRTNFEMRESPDFLRDEYGDKVQLVERETFDGRVAMSLDHPVGTDRIASVGTVQQAERRLKVGEIHRRHPRAFGRYETPANITSANLALVGEETLDEGHCAVLQSGDGTKRLWVCPEKGYLIVREEHYPADGGNTPSEAIEYWGIEKFGEYFFPRHAKFRYVRSNGEPSCDLEFQFTQVELNVPVASEEFRIEFTDGTNVTDLQAGVHYTVGELEREIGRDIETVAPDDTKSEGPGGTDVQGTEPDLRPGSEEVRSGAPAEPPQNPSRGNLLLWAGIGLVALFVAVGLATRFRPHREP